MSVHIRLAAGPDRDDIRDVHLQAFPDSENRLVATLAVNLLDEEADPGPFALVAEVGGIVVGHIAFSPVVADSTREWLGYILAPLGVKPEHQRIGIGSKLVEDGMVRIATTAAGVVLVYGDPEYYGRFGFDAEAAARFIPPYELKHPFGWLARPLGQLGADRQALRLSCVASLRNPALW